FDAGNFLAELPGTNRARVSCRPAADHNEVVFRGFSHERRFGATVARPPDTVKRKRGGAGAGSRGQGAGKTKGVRLKARGQNLMLPAPCSLLQRRVAAPVKRQ